MTLTNSMDIIGSIALVGGALLVLLSNRNKAATEAQNRLIQAQKDRLDILEKQHIESAKLIGQLQGQLTAYKDLPLKEIAHSMKAISEGQKTTEVIMQTIATGQASIIEILKANGLNTGFIDPSNKPRTK